MKIKKKSEGGGRCLDRCERTIEGFFLKIEKKSGGGCLGG